MAFFPDIFGSAKSAAQPATNTPTNPGPGKLPSGETSSLEKPQNTQEVSGQPSGTKTSEEPNASPLDPFKDLWQPDPTPKDGPQTGNDKAGVTYDPAKIRESVKKLDFGKVIDPALAQKALAGDVSAFSQVVSSVAQAAVSSAMTANLGILNSALERHEGRIFEKLPTEMRRFSASDASLSENPSLNHPSVRPLFEVVQQQLVKKYPEASTTEIRKMASEYMTEALKAMNPEKSDGSGKKPAATGSFTVADIQGADQNWEEFFGLGT